MDKIFITDLHVDTIIGIYDFERDTKQQVVIDLEMGTDIQAAAASENIEKTLNYKEISERIYEFVAASNFQLIETMAEKIAEIVRGEFGVSWCKVTVHKPSALPDRTNVGVCIERG